LIPFDECFEAGLVNRHDVQFETIDFAFVDIGAADAVACFSETCAYDEPNVAGANYRYVHETRV